MSRWIKFFPGRCGRAFGTLAPPEPRDKTDDNPFEEENSYYESAEVRSPQEDRDLLPHGGGDVHQLQWARCLEQLPGRGCGVFKVHGKPEGGKKCQISSTGCLHTVILSTLCDLPCRHLHQPHIYLQKCCQGHLCLHMAMCMDGVNQDD